MARATSDGRPGDAVTLGCSGAAFFVVVVLVPVLVELPDGVVVVDVSAAGLFPGAELLPLSLPFVTTNVATRSRAPSAAMIAGRGSSIRGELGTSRVVRSLPTAYSARKPGCLSRRVTLGQQARQQFGRRLSCPAREHPCRSIG